MGDGNWVVLAPDEDRFIEDLSRADSLRICGPNRELPRGIGNGRSYRFGGARYTPDELEMLREEAKLLAMLKPAGDAESGVHEFLCRCVPADRSVLVPDESAGPDDMVIDESKSNIGKRGALPRKDDGSECVIISGNEFFGRIVRAWSIWAELEDLALVEFGSQMVACQRMKKDYLWMRSASAEFSVSGRKMGCSVLLLTPGASINDVGDLHPCGFVLEMA